jgi:hypothetical protein
LFDELQPVDEKSLAGLKTAEPVHQPDRDAPVNPEHTLEDGAVDDRSREPLQLLESTRKSF